MRDAFGRWIAVTARRAAWAPFVVFGLHLVFSRVLGTYEAWPPLDVPMHLAGGVAIAYFASHATVAATELGILGAPSRAALLALVFTGACSAAVFWEFAEFLSDRWLGTQAQKGLEDTLADMAFGIAGALAYLALARFPAARPERVELERRAP